MGKFIEEEVVTPTGYTRWVRPVMKKYKIGCCDCGLVHIAEFRIWKGRVEFRMKRNNRSTGQLRRWMKKRNTSTLR